MHINRQVIAELKELMEEEFPILIRTFIDDSHLRLDRLLLHTSQKNYEEIKREAHSFKGSSSNMGAIQLSELCLQLEQHATKSLKENPSAISEAVKSTLENIHLELTLVTQELSQY